MQGILKRGMWRYDMTDAAFTQPQAQLDNGITYDLLGRHKLIEEKKEFLKLREKAMQVLKEPEVVKKDPKKGKLPIKGAPIKKK